MKLIALAAAALLAAAPAPGGANYRPMVDTGTRIGVYEQDLAECQSYAQRVAGASEGAAAGAVGGAIVIGLLSAVLGGGGHGAGLLRGQSVAACRALPQARPISAPWLCAACLAVVTARSIKETDMNKLHPAFTAALAPFAPPQSEVHRIISEADLLEADRARNVNKAERLTQLAAERDLDQQIQHQDEWGWRK